MKRNKVDIVKLILTDRRSFKEQNRFYSHSSNHSYDHYSKSIESDIKEWAMKHGYNDIIDLLNVNNYIKERYHGRETLFKASQNGDAIVVKRLLSEETLFDHDINKTIKVAAESGYLAVVKLLVGDSRIDPSDDDNYAIRYARRRNHYRIMHTLLYHPKVQSCLWYPRQFYDEAAIPLKEDAYKMIPYYSNAFYETYQLPDDIMHVILGEFTFGYTTKECMTLLKCI